jgi:hypothetical protein
MGVERAEMEGVTVEKNRPDWTSSLVGVVPALRQLLAERQELRPLDARLMGFLADDLLDDVTDFRSIARFRPKTLPAEAPSDLRRAVAAAVREVDRIDPSNITPEETTRLLNDLQEQLRALSTKGPDTVGADEERLLKILDRVCDHLYGVQASRAS